MGPGLTAWPHAHSMPLALSPPYVLSVFPEESVPKRQFGMLRMLKPGRLLGVLALGGLLFCLTFTGLGMGDVKLGGLLGLILGFQAGASALFLVGLTCGVVGLGLLATHRVKRRTLLPFAPFLGLGVVVILAGQTVGLVWL